MSIKEIEARHERVEAECPKADPYRGMDAIIAVEAHADRAFLLAEVKRLQTAWDSAVQQAMQNGAKVGRLRALNQRAAACIESLSMSDAAYNLVAELKEASE